jgi:hypothetical protein
MMSLCLYARENVSFPVHVLSIIEQQLEGLLDPLFSFFSGKGLLQICQKARGTPSESFLPFCIVYGDVTNDTLHAGWFAWCVSSGSDPLVKA